MEPKPLTTIIDTDKSLSVIECEASFIYRLGLATLLDCFSVLEICFSKLT